MLLPHWMSSRPSARHTILTFAVRPIDWLIALLPLLALLACGADRSTGAGETPPHSGIAISTDKSYKGSVTAGDSLWYRFSAEEGKSFAAILEVDNGAVTVAILGSAGGPVMQTMKGAAIGPDAPGYSSTKAFESSDPRVYYIVLTGSASFQLSVHQGSDLPEVAPYVLPVGDTILGESIDDLVAHDVDAFRLMGRPGDEYNVFLQVVEGGESQVVRLEALDAIGADVVVRGDGRDTSLTQHATGSFLLPASGIVNLRAAGVVDMNGNTTAGHYRLFVYRIDRRPESGSAELIPSDSITIESIDFPSDVDEYGFELPESTWVSVAIDCSPAAATLWARVIGAGGSDGAAVYTCHSPAQPRSSTGRMLLAPGSYTVRVSAPDIAEQRQIGGYSGRYNLYGYKLDSAPEHASASVSVGDTIEGESLAPVGDVDTFILDGHRGDDVNIFLYGLEERWRQNMRLFLGYSDGRGGPLGLAYSAEDGEPAPSTGHIVLPGDGKFPVIVGPTNQGEDGAEYGPYRMVIQRVSRAVEHHVAGISVGDVVSDERLDDRDDVDEFALAGAPGQLVAASVSADPSTMGVRLEVVDPASREILAWSSSNPDRPIGVTDHFALSQSGRAAVRVYRATDVVDGPVGDYELEVHNFDPAPENVPAQIAIGDTISGERIDPLGDFDEYTFSGTVGDRLEIYFNPVDSLDHEWPLRVEVLQGESDRLLMSALNGQSSAGLGTLHTEPFTLPVTGSYVVRVRGFDNEHGDGEYAVAVERAP